MYVQHTHNPLGHFFYFFMIHKIIFFDKDAKFSVPKNIFQINHVSHDVVYKNNRIIFSQ